MGQLGCLEHKATGQEKKSALQTQATTTYRSTAHQKPHGVSISPQAHSKQLFGSWPDKTQQLVSLISRWMTVAVAEWVLFEDKGKTLCLPFFWRQIGLTGFAPTYLFRSKCKCWILTIPKHAALKNLLYSAPSNSLFVKLWVTKQQWLAKQYFYKASALLKITY